MAEKFTMPQLGLTMTEAIVIQWHKSVGDPVVKGDLLIEVETDKINYEVESTLEGTLLQILVPEGDVAPVKAPLAIIGQPGEEVIRKRSGEAMSVELPSSGTLNTVSASAEGASTGDRIKASPIAKRIAREKDISLETLSGTGPDGRIVERDVLALQQSSIESGVSNQNSATAPMSGMRKVIAERISMSWQTAPHVNMTVETDMTAASDLKQHLTQASGVKISYTDIIVKIAAQVLTEIPIVNSSLVNGQIVRHETVNVGLAVALENGLIVPVIRNADLKTISGMNEEIAFLSGKARSGNLGKEDIAGGTFTVSNLGMFGVDHFTPIINQPESAILGICRIVDRPVIQDGVVVIRPIMNLCLSFDHRIIDGAVGARFLSRLRQLLEQPLLLL